MERPDRVSGKAPRHGRRGRNPVLVPCRHDQTKFASIGAVGRLESPSADDQHGQATASKRQRTWRWDPREGKRTSRPTTADEIPLLPPLLSPRVGIGGPDTGLVQSPLTNTTQSKRERYGNHGRGNPLAGSASVTPYQHNKDARSSTADARLLAAPTGRGGARIGPCDPSPPPPTPPHPSNGAATNAVVGSVATPPASTAPPTRLHAHVLSGWRRWPPPPASTHLQRLTTGLRPAVAAQWSHSGPPPPPTARLVRVDDSGGSTRREATSRRRQTAAAPPGPVAAPGRRASPVGGRRAKSPRRRRSFRRGGIVRPPLAFQDRTRRPLHPRRP